MAVPRELYKPRVQKCIMCDGSMEKSNLGNICNTCRDKMRKT